MGHRPFTGGTVIFERQPLTLERQLLECASLHRLADLALDQALPGMCRLRSTLGVTALRAHRPDRTADSGILEGVKAHSQSTSRRVRLRDVTLADADLLDTWRNERGGFNDFDMPADRIDREALAAGPFRSERRGLLIVELVEDGRPIGTVSWHSERYGPNPESSALNFGIELLPEERGHGYGTEAQALLVDLLFEITPTYRVEASTDIENIAEQRSLEKAGLHRDGVFRKVQFRAGAYHDLVVYSRLRDDP